MEVSFGITGKDFVIFASDSSANRSIVRMKANEDKQRVIGKHLLLAYTGEPGDTLHFAEYVERNLRLYQIRNHLPLRPSSAASWTRLQLATSLRSRKPYSVNLLVGGYDPTSSTAELYWIDMYGTLGTVPYAAHGYGAYFALSTMDRYHSPDLTLDQAMVLLRRCVNELETRFIVNLGTFKVRVADKDGVREIPIHYDSSITPSLPAPVAVQPAPVVVQPAPVVVQPAPVSV